MLAFPLPDLLSPLLHHFLTLRAPRVDHRVTLLALEGMLERANLLRVARQPNRTRCTPRMHRGNEGQAFWGFPFFAKLSWIVFVQAEAILNGLSGPLGVSSPVGSYSTVLALDLVERILLVYPNGSPTIALDEVWLRGPSAAAVSALPGTKLLRSVINIPFSVNISGNLVRGMAFVFRAVVAQRVQRLRWLSILRGRERVREILVAGL